MEGVSLDAAMALAIDLAASARRVAPPTPWVGAVLVNDDGVVVGRGATRAPGDAHAEVVALADASDQARGSTLFVTLEPCCHVGRTGPCVDAILAAGVKQVYVAVLDPDPRVAGRGVARLREAGVDVIVGLGDAAVREQLAAYLWHRSTGRPYVIAKVAATLDGRVAMTDASSQWITGPDARRDGHELRADSDVIVVGAGTVRSDNPQLTARLDGVVRHPRRVVLGAIPPGAACEPAESYVGDLEPLLTRLGQEHAVQVLVEGGPRTVASFVEQGLVNRLVWYVAPALAGSTGGRGALDGLSTPTIAALRRGRFVAIRQIGEDVRLDLEVPCP